MAVDPLKRAALVAAAACLALAQLLSVGHAASGEAFAPDHDVNNCIFHMAGDRTPAAPPPSGELLLRPAGTMYPPAPAEARIAPLCDVQPLPPPRGPPSV